MPDNGADVSTTKSLWSGILAGGCHHPQASPVTTIDDEHVGYICPDCDLALPTDWNVFEGLAPAEQFTVLALAQLGHDPYDVRERVIAHRTACDGHTAHDCPKRVEVTSISEREPQFVHGACACVAAGDAVD